MILSSFNAASAKRPTSRYCYVLSLPICPGLSVPFRLSVPHFSLSVPCKKHYCPTLKLPVPCANISVPRSKFLFEDEGEGEGVEVERKVVVVADKYKMVLAMLSVPGVLILTQMVLFKIYFYLL